MTTYTIPANYTANRTNQNRIMKRNASDALQPIQRPFNANKGATLPSIPNHATMAAKQHTTPLTATIPLFVKQDNWYKANEFVFPAKLIMANIEHWEDNDKIEYAIKDGKTHQQHIVMLDGSVQPYGDEFEKTIDYVYGYELLGSAKTQYNRIIEGTGYRKLKTPKTPSDVSAYQAIVRKHKNIGGTIVACSDVAGDNRAMITEINNLLSWYHHTNKKRSQIISLVDLQLKWLELLNKLIKWDENDKKPTIVGQYDRPKEIVKNYTEQTVLIWDNTKSAYRTLTLKEHRAKSKAHCGVFKTIKKRNKNGQTIQETTVSGKALLKTVKRLTGIALESGQLWTGIIAGSVGKVKIS